MQMVASPGLNVVGIRSKDGRFVAEFLPYSSQWMVGGIEGRKFEGDGEREAMARDIMACIEQVSHEQQAYSTCTDGRERLRLEDGKPVPVREQLVGTDTMMAFVAAEALGERFYDRDKELYASVTVRLHRVVSFLLEHGIQPTGHISCGAAGGFTGVMSRATQFIGSADYTARLQAVMPAGTYDSVLHRFIVGGYRSRLDSKVYEGYYDGLVNEIVREKVGSQAVECFHDDGRGVHGHREQAIAYLDDSISGQALNPNSLNSLNGSQVFGVNAARMRAVAGLFSRGGTDRMDYVTALIALHDFAAAGHGTLANGMETLIIRSAAS